MNLTLFYNDILFYQRLLKSAGFYTGKLDGINGPLTRAADAAFLECSAALKTKYGGFDKRSESCLGTLLPATQISARQMMQLALDSGRQVSIISGTRSYQEQHNLYRQGRYGDKRPVVTRARAGQSQHNFGLAWDIGIFEQGRYVTTTSAYIQLANEVLPRLQQLAWGGHWSGLKDYPHYQLATGTGNINTIRAAFEQGRSYTRVNHL